MNARQLSFVGSALFFSAGVAGCGADASRSTVPDHRKPADTAMPAAPPALLAPITANGLAEISGAAADDIWAVGSKGTAVHYDGKKWSLVPSGTTENLLGVYTAGPHDAWAAGDTEVMVRWDGAAWSQVLAPSSGELIGVWGSGTSDVWAAGIDEGAAFLRHWDGDTWEYNWFDPEPSFWDVWGSGPDDVWAAGSAGADLGHVFRYDGTQMQRVDYNGPPLRSINGTSADDVWFVAQASPMEHWNGTSFEVPDGPDITGTLFDVWASAPDNAWACGTDGQMLHWEGTAWTKVPLGTSVTLQGLWGTAADNVWAVGAAGTILHYDGTAWTSVFSPAPAAPAPIATP